jgi:sarcosine oxidase subunit beta
MRYSIFSLARNAASRHENWPLAWRSPEPKPSYDAIVVGGGGHGLATAYYLAKEQGISNVAVLEKGWLGGGSARRNATIVHSTPPRANAHFYEFSLKLWESLSQQLKQRHARRRPNLVHSPADMDAAIRRGNDASERHRANSEPRRDRAWIPRLDTSPQRASLSSAAGCTRGSTVRHDAVAWGCPRR